MEPAPGPEPQDTRGHHDLDPGQQAQQPTTQGQPFHGLGFQHPPQELPGPLLAHLLWGKAQGTREQAGFQQPADPECQTPLRPGAPQTQGKHRHAEESPRQQPGGIEAPVQRPPPEQPPGQDAAQVLGRIRPEQPAQVLGEMGLSELLPERGRGRQAQDPARLKTLCH